MSWQILPHGGRLVSLVENGRIYLLIGVNPCASFPVVCRKERLTRTVHYRNCQSQSGFALKQHHPLLSRALSRCACHSGAVLGAFSLLGSTSSRRARRADDRHARATEGGAVEVCAETVRRDRRTKKRRPPCWNEKGIVECCIYIAAKQE